ncbi:MAG: GntR family transcriptional regulator [Rhizobiaceae bacterium]|nr:GntR family transcriptional regulator [Rhizobiaceae bacterium]
MAKRASPVPATAHARIQAALRQALMNGDYRPGQRLVVRTIAEQFSTSPMPVREALRQLVSEEALFDHANRGVIVPVATVEVISDLVRVRCSIEGSAAEWAASTVTRAEREAMVEIDDQMKDFAARGAAAGYLALHREFHFALYRAARSPVLLPIIERLWLRAGPWLNIMREEATLGQGLDHHAEILDALERGDGQKARRAVVADISDAADIMLRAATGTTAPEPRRARVRGSEAPRERMAATARRA